MAGHSHWANIAHKKGIADKKRGKLFSKLSRYIIIAAKNGGGDPDQNLKLRYAIDKARAASLSKDTIEKAIKRGTGELGGAAEEELIYEGFGPGGVAIIVEAMTDNRNRTGGDVRKIFEKGGGNMGGPGCVSYMFDRKGIFIVPKTAAKEDDLLTLSLEAGADDMSLEGDNYEITCEVGLFNQVANALEQSNIHPTSSEMSQLPKTWVEVEEETGRKIIKLLDALDDNEDVQNVYTNANLTEAMMGE